MRPAGCLGRCTRKYLSRKPASREGSGPPQLTHVRSAVADGASTSTTLYFAPQLGQLNGVGLRCGMCRLCQSSTPSDKPWLRERPRPKVLICRTGASSKTPVFLGFTPFGFVFFSNSALVILKVLKRTDVHLKRSFSIERRASESLEFGDQLALLSNNSPRLSHAMYGHDQFGSFSRHDA